jgi:hypothetical protein
VPAAPLPARPRPRPPGRPPPPADAAPAAWERHAALLAGDGALSRAADELRVVQAFARRQLSSLVQPPATAFVLWLSLQREGFYRGGRSASERLSAARIGERVRCVWRAPMFVLGGGVRVVLRRAYCHVFATTFTSRALEAYICDAGPTLK